MVVYRGIYSVTYMVSTLPSIIRRLVEKSIYHSSFRRSFVKKKALFCSEAKKTAKGYIKWQHLFSVHGERKKRDVNCTIFFQSL